MNDDVYRAILGLWTWITIMAGGFSVLGEPEQSLIWAVVAAVGIVVLGTTFALKKVLD